MLQMYELFRNYRRIFLLNDRTKENKCSMTYPQIPIFQDVARALYRCFGR